MKKSNKTETDMKIFSDTMNQLIREKKIEFGRSQQTDGAGKEALSHSPVRKSSWSWTEKRFGKDSLKFLLRTDCRLKDTFPAWKRGWNA